jgi:ABC-2 type transport system permease protein
MRDLFLAFWKVVIRTSAFVRKEVVNIVRQPRLLLTLVLGPFLILLIFGIGYRNQPRALRTLFVARKGNELIQQIKENAPKLGPQLVFMGITDDEAAALQKLRRGEVDLVAVAPEKALESIQAGQQAEFKLYNREIDPLQVSYVAYFGKIYIDEVNRRVLVASISQSQAQVKDLQGDLEAARTNASAVEQALQTGDKVVAREHLTRMSNNLNRVSLVAGTSLSVLNGVEQSVGGEENQGIGEIKSLVSDVQHLSQAMQTSDVSSAKASDWKAQVNQIDSNLGDLETRLDTFARLDPNVVVSPFNSEALSIAEVQPDAPDFYAPAVIALLIQHLAVAIAALSTVQERNFGTMELFRVSPLSAGEMLVGKYLSYLLFGTVIAASLTALMHFVLGVPMLGSWVNYALVVEGLLFTSLGIGFVISLVSHTDSQAVQYTMIVLLTSVFFSGFMMSLTMLWEPVRALSWAIPTTYGIVLLREITLRGIFSDPSLLIVLILIGLGLCLWAWVLLRRKIANQ